MVDQSLAPNHCRLLASAGSAGDLDRADAFFARDQFGLREKEPDESAISSVKSPVDGAESVISQLRDQQVVTDASRAEPPGADRPG